MSAIEEEHARQLLSVELDTEMRVHDDGSVAHMPDLVSVDRNHVAEVITTARASAREAQQRLGSVAEGGLPHCVWVVVPYVRVGGLSREVRRRIVGDVVRWTEIPQCAGHWPSVAGGPAYPNTPRVPLLPLRAYDDGVEVFCAEMCQHEKSEIHEVKWVVGHAPPDANPWQMIRESLRIVDEEHRGGVDALVSKLEGYPNKHLVIYPFGPPGNLSAELSAYQVPQDLADFAPPRLNPPISDLHLWLVYHYGDATSVEGLHLCNGHWARFGTDLPNTRAAHQSSPSQYRGGFTA